MGKQIKHLANHSPIQAIVGDTCDPEYASIPTGVSIQQFIDKFLPITPAEKNCRFKLDAKEELRKECRVALEVMMMTSRFNGAIEKKLNSIEKR